MKAFFDTHVMVYAADPRAGLKHLQAGQRFGDLEVVHPFALGAHEALPAPRIRAKRCPRSAARQG